MKRILYRLGSLAAAAVIAAGAVTACAQPGQPQQRPGANVPGAPAGTADLGESISRTISTVDGAGPAEAVVLGNVVLVALNLDGSPTEGFNQGPGPTTPGGGEGARTDAPAGTPGNAAAAPSAPGAAAGRPDQTGVAVGQPGGGMAPGTTTPGGTPTGTGATPNATGAPALVGTNTGAATNGPGQTGTQMDLYTRVADVIRSQFPWVAEVRFAVDRDDAQRLAAIATEMRNGTPLTHRLDELYSLATRMSPTSTTTTDRTPGFGAPTPGATGAPGAGQPGPATPGKP